MSNSQEVKIDLLKDYTEESLESARQAGEKIGQEWATKMNQAIIDILEK